ncbi:hypothetical protein Moror_17559 [Moniliophthora roreri MCA 2997]|uniref:Nucleoporin nup82 n=2 Tax=Moniliophthora roreri TaxID=221103 RepID=V2Z0R0_MONRO|nr:hypothetical protein Moror_17559 [Moniliophthora roreri MCA 2997]KAI3612488.1 hypothetical protein WG66_009934 [Moniliophthora roreri]
MDNDQLSGHPIFSLPKSFSVSPHDNSSLELSTNTLFRSSQANSKDDDFLPTRRRRVMVLRDTDLIVAAGKELRITSLGDAKFQKSLAKSYKTLHTPNIQFEIHQICINSNGKLLAVAGAHQVAVVVLPRAGYSRLIPETIDCKSIQIGQFYHAHESAVPVVKLEWHPWGEAGSTLMVMTVDGKLREYDISVDTDEPQQVLSFVPEKKLRKSYLAEDSSEREVASFTLGKGGADWGPLTVYAVMRSGDIYAICPYMPKNALIPSAYVHSLECFISAKQEFLAQTSSNASSNLSTLYAYQQRYVAALIKQLPPGTVFPAPSRSILMHSPQIVKSPPARQGPFLLQPSPRMLEGSEGGDATDITYLSFGRGYDKERDEDRPAVETLDVVLVTYQDGKVDLCLDVEKVEARWDSKQISTSDLPMLAVYESVDLGLVALLNSVSSSPNSSNLELLQGNYPVLAPDPINCDTFYVYHAFGVHALNLRPVLQNLLSADEDSGQSLQLTAGTTVQPILSTFSVERKSSNPVIAVAIPDDVYLSYSIFILTSAMRITTFSLIPRPESPRPKAEEAESTDLGTESNFLKPLDGPPAYVSLLGSEPWKSPPVLARATGLPSNPQLSLPTSGMKQVDFMLTPDTLRYLASTAAHLIGQVHEVQLAQRGAEGRAALQSQELIRLCGKCRELQMVIDRLKGPRRQATEVRLQKVQEQQKLLLRRLDRLLQTMMEKASPELSEHETKWFEELKRMKEEVMGAGRYDEGSLATRINLLQREYARLTPNLKHVLEKERERRKKLAEVNKGLEFSQAFEFGERSNHERARITEVEQQVLDLAAKLDVTLGRPPSVIV